MVAIVSSVSAGEKSRNSESKDHCKKESGSDEDWG